MSIVQRVAQLFGVVFILVGALGFVSGSMNMSTGLELGLFPVNVLHNLVHIAFGVWGLAASRSFGGAKLYAQAGGVIYLVLAILGVITPNLLGLVPLGGYDVWLHAVLGIVLAGAGFSARESSSSMSASAAA